MKKKISIHFNKHETLYLGLIHIIITFFYGTEIIKEYPISYLLYSFICLLIIKQILHRKFLFRLNFGHDIDYLTIKIFIYCIMAIVFLNVDNINLPNLLLINYADRIDSKAILNSTISSTALLSAIILGNSNKFSDKILSSIAIATMYIISGSTSRGGLLIYFILLYIPWRNNRHIKSLMYLAFIIMVLFFIYIFNSRLGLENISIEKLLESDVSQLSKIHSLSTDLQPNKNNLIYFFIPSSIKGEWIATNQYISESLLGLSVENIFYYVITVGDFAVYKLGYDSFWLIYFVYGFSMCVFLMKVITHILPTHKFYYYSIFILIGSRAGTESLLTVFLHGNILPLFIITFTLLIARTITEKYSSPPSL